MKCRATTQSTRELTSLPNQGQHHGAVQNGENFCAIVYILGYLPSEALRFAGRERQITHPRNNAATHPKAFQNRKNFRSCLFILLQTCTNNHEVMRQHNFGVESVPGYNHVSTQNSTVKNQPENRTKILLSAHNIVINRGFNSIISSGGLRYDCVSPLMIVVLGREWLLPVLHSDGPRY